MKEPQGTGPALSVLERCRAAGEQSLATWKPKNVLDVTSTLEDVACCLFGLDPVSLTEADLAGHARIIMASALALQKFWLATCPSDAEEPVQVNVTGLSLHEVEDLLKPDATAEPPASSCSVVLAEELAAYACQASCDATPDHVIDALLAMPGHEALRAMQAVVELADGLAHRVVGPPARLLLSASRAARGFDGSDDIPF